MKLAHTRSVVGLAGLCAALGSAVALVRCGDDSSSCDACADVTATPLTVALTPAEIWIHPSDAKPIAVALARNAGGGGDVAVTIETDAGFTADPLTIADGKTDGTLVVHVPPSFTQGQTTLIVDAQTPTTLAQAQLIVHVAGASGTLDTSFGASGVAALDPGNGKENGRAMIVLQSGVLVGVTHVESSSSMKVLRLTSSGAIDGAFATTTSPGDLAGLAMLPDGRIFAVGDGVETNSDFAVLRIGAAGGIDQTFDVDTPIPGVGVVANAAAIQPGGSLVAAGTSQAITLARWTQVPLVPSDAGGSDASDDASSDATSDANDGAASDASDAEASPNTAHFDPTFGDGGVVFGPAASSATALLVGGDGSLYVIGSPGSAGALALHYSPNGAIDTTFGDAGTALVTTNDSVGPTAAILEPSGDVVGIVGTSLFRLSPTGAVSQTAALPKNAWSALARDPASGAIYVGGTIGATCQIMRLTSALQPDATFGVGWFANDVCSVVALGVDDDGKVLALASIQTGVVTHAAVSRYWP